MSTALKSDILRVEEGIFHSPSPWLFDVNILLWSSEIRELVQLITESSRYQLEEWMLHFATCYEKRMKMPKKYRKVQMRGENKPGVHSLCKYSRTLKKRNKMLAVHLHQFTTKMKFLSFIPRGVLSFVRICKGVKYTGLALYYSETCIKQTPY